VQELAGKTAFVSGGASGIGLALGRAFAEVGMQVMLADIETEALAAAVKSLHNFGPDVRGVTPCSASKFAVVTMSEGLAMHLKPLGIGVTVLCPGWVRTRINESGRNRSARYGPARTPKPGTWGSEIAAHVAEHVQSGLDPSDVAAHVLTAIREDELYVFTHPEMRVAAEERFAAILTAMGKPGVR
jgi:NAD(P)-dependent dehydrogenase (short-subunit alcohol dehydrogenase family)